MSDKTNCSQSIKTGIVIPCYNEEHRLSVDTFTDALEKNPEITFLFVNDGSRDNTSGVIQKICETNQERALSLSLDKNKGKGEAVRLGMSRLVKDDSYKVIGFWDADTAVSLSEICDFVDVFRLNPNIQAVIGSRVHLAGRQIEHVNFRHYAGRIFATIVCWSFHFSVYDTQCGTKLFRREALIPVIQEPFLPKWIFDVEIIIRLSRQGRNDWLYELPVKQWKNVRGTKRSPGAYITAVFDYFRLIKKYGL